MISPIILRIGPIQITYYVLVYVLGFVGALFLLLHFKKDLKLKSEQCYDLTFYLLVGVTAGARLFHAIFWRPNYFLNDPIKLFYIWQGGLSFHGGLVGSALVLYIYTKKNKLSFLKFADVLVLPAALAHAFQRISNFLNQEIVGTVTNLPWCVTFNFYKGCRHPVQIYASAGRFVLFGFLVYLKSLRKFKPGFVFWVYVLFSGIGRFALDFIREDAVYFGLKSGQWLSIPMIIVGGYVLIKYYPKHLSTSYSSKNQ
jgi:phosphatidylglycerol---prolipoprotein diacylglyceryl transferase